MAVLNWFGRKKKKTKEGLIENVLHEADRLNAFDMDPEEEQQKTVSEEENLQIEDDQAEQKSDVADMKTEYVPEPEPEAETVVSSLADDESAETVLQPQSQPKEFVSAADVDYVEDNTQEKHVKKGFFTRLKEGLSKTRDAIFGRIDSVFSAFSKVDEELFEELEETLIMADIGVDTSVYMINELRSRAKAKHITEPVALKDELKEIIEDILRSVDAEMHIEQNKPAVIMVIGVNGVGKTTSIGKMAHFYREQGKKVVLAAADTFRAAAIDQLQIWAQRANVDIVKHQEGSDPSAVVFDAISAAKARGADVVICDTAGRLHNKKNLMEELAKTARVIERETGAPAAEVLLVLDASTGQNALIQAREFANAAKITGVVLTKLDGTAKGGVIIALSREQDIGVKFIGVGESIDDFRAFDPEDFARALFPEEQ